MLGSVVGKASQSSTANRAFRYEVVGLRQNDATDNMDHAIRSSSSIFITVPFSRMNEEMCRISRMGGTIVSIQPVLLSDESASDSAPAAE